MRIRLPRTGADRPRTVLVAALCVAASLRPGSQAAVSDDSFAATGHLAGRYAAQVRSFLPLLAGAPEAGLLSAAIVDAHRAVAELDRLVAGAPILGPSRDDVRALRQTAAAAHLELALLETRAFDFDAARGDVDRARDILGQESTEGFRAAWSVLQEGAPGSALITRSEYLSLTEFEAALRALWSRARPAVFDLTGAAARELPELTLEAAPEGSVQPLDRPLVARGATLLRRALSSGQRTFSVPLPPGTYRLRSRPGSGLERTFLIPEAADPDPIVLGAARFGLTVEPADRSRGPRFFLNGVEVTNLGSMPFGYYRVSVDESFIQAAPERIRFIPGLGVDNRSRSTWTIFIPEGKTGELRFGAAALGGRLRD